MKTLKINDKLLNLNTQNLHVLVKQLCKNAFKTHQKASTNILLIT